MPHSEKIPLPWSKLYYVMVPMLVKEILTGVPLYTQPVDMERY